MDDSVEISEVMEEVVRALLYETAHAIILLRAGRLGGGVSDNGGCRFTRIGECLFAVAGLSEMHSQIAKVSGHTRVVCAERLLFDGQRALVEPLSVGVLALFVEQVLG